MRRASMFVMAATAVALGIAATIQTAGRNFNTHTGPPLHGTIFALVVMGGAALAAGVIGFDKTSPLAQASNRAFWWGWAILMAIIALLGWFALTR